MADDVARLVHEARGGDLEAYGALVSRFQDAVYGSALARLGNWHDAEEAALLRPFPTPVALLYTGPQLLVPGARVAGSPSQEAAGDREHSLALARVA